MQVIAALVFVLLICVTASSSFQREKENGAFELLLVSHHSPKSGSFSDGSQRSGITTNQPQWYCFVYDILSRELRAHAVSGAQLLSVCLSGITVPVAGLYFALTSKHFLVILASTAFCALLLPLFRASSRRLVRRLV